VFFLLKKFSSAPLEICDPPRDPHGNRERKGWETGREEHMEAIAKKE
jgi:hypothetical protein